MPRFVSCRVQKLIRMNMPVADDMTVQFTTTLFALIRESLQIKMGHASEMDELDKELRDAVIKLWPLQAQKKLYFLLPPKDGTLQSTALYCLLPVPCSLVYSRAHAVHLLVLYLTQYASHFLLAETAGNKLSVGKIYTCFLIAEGWRANRQAGKAGFSSSSSNKRDGVRALC